MIKDQQTYWLYRKVEKSKSGLKEFLYPEPTRVFLKWLRRVECHYNSGVWYHKLLFLFAYHRYRKISLQTGFSIPKNVCDRVCQSLIMAL